MLVKNIFIFYRLKIIIILTALKIPVEMFTPIFVIGRTVGWITQWSELKQDPTAKIARPRQLYTGK